MTVDTQPQASPTFRVKMEQFEGPLDLLLGLIEKRKLFINEISLAKITDDYIAHISNLGSFPMGDGAHFILIASTLILIKSRSLLPNLLLTLEEEESVADLERRLVLYKEIKELSLHVKDRFGKDILFEPEERKAEPIFSPSEEISLLSLAESMTHVLEQLPKKEVLPKTVVKKVISLEQAIGSLTDRIKSSLKMSFRDFAGVNREEKVNVIVGFLAVLELVKQGIIHVTQEKDFDDISIETNDISVPNYT